MEVSLGLYCKKQSSVVVSSNTTSIYPGVQTVVARRWWSCLGLSRWMAIITLEVIGSSKNLRWWSRSTCSSTLRDSSWSTSLGLQRFVVCLLPAGFGGLDLTILILESSSVCLSSQHLLHHGLFSLLIGQSSTEELSWALDDSAHLWELWYLRPRRFFFVMSLWIQDSTHTEELEITLELRSYDSLREVKPLFASSSFLSLIDMLALVEEASFNQGNLCCSSQCNYEYIEHHYCRAAPKTGPNSASCRSLELSS